MISEGIFQNEELQHGFTIMQSFFGFLIKFKFQDVKNKKEMFLYYLHDVDTKEFKPFSFDCYSTLTQKDEFILEVDCTYHNENVPFKDRFTPEKEHEFLREMTQKYFTLDF